MKALRTLRVLALGALALAAALAHAQQASEAALKAAFVYKFVGYVEWPARAFASPEAPIVIGVAGAEEVAAELERLVPARTVNGRPVQVRRIREGEGLRGVHALFIGRGELAERMLLRAATQEGVLSITESSLEAGSVINFVPLDDRIGFEVSLENADKAGLRISARMLSVARRVVPKA